MSRRRRSQPTRRLTDSVSSTRRRTITTAGRRHYARAIYGAEAGNFALKVVALGGVYVGGGIAPKIRSTLAAGGFVRAFRDKGRFARVRRLAEAGGDVRRSVSRR